MSMYELMAECSSRSWYWNISGRDGLKVGDDLISYRSCCIFSYEGSEGIQVGSCQMNTTDLQAVIKVAFDQAVAATSRD